MTCCKSTSTGVGIPTTAPTNNDPDIYIEQPSGQIWVWNGTNWTKPSVGSVSYNSTTRVLTVGSSSVTLPKASKTEYGVVKLDDATNSPITTDGEGNLVIDCAKLITHCNLPNKAYVDSKVADAIDCSKLIAHCDLATKSDLTTAVGGINIPSSLPPSGTAGGVLAGSYPHPNALTITTCGGTPYKAGMKTPNCEETSAMIAAAMAGAGEIITATYPELPQFVNSLGGIAHHVKGGNVSITLPRTGVVNIYAIMFQRSNSVSAFTSHMDIWSSISGEIVSTYGYYPVWDNGDQATQSYAGYSGTAGEVISFSTSIKSEIGCTVEIAEASLRVQYVV